MNEYIALENVCFTYKKTGFLVRDVSLKLYTGEITVIVGNNGSGKTTLSKLIMGILKAQSGRVSIDGQDIANLSLSAVAKKIGYLFQNPERQLFCNSVLEEIKFSLVQNGQDDASANNVARNLLDQFSMQDKAALYPLKLSRGEKQRLALMAVLAMKPGFYLLDEPSSGIDQDNKDRLINMLTEFRQQGAGLCIVTHDKELIERLAERIVTMDGGKVVSDEKA